MVRVEREPRPRYVLLLEAGLEMRPHWVWVRRAVAWYIYSNSTAIRTVLYCVLY